jgi:site-specific DNA-methyltransferase (adenine-specific)
MALTLEPYLNTVMEGDCLDIMGNFQHGSIDLILCDLPYGTTTNPWDIPINFASLWQQYKRIIKSQLFAKHEILSALKKIAVPITKKSNP